MNVGSIHGRFQPFHNAHLEYAIAALKHVDMLYIGLTKILTEQKVGTDVAPHRFLEEENPLTYYQRFEVTRCALLDAGVDASRFIIGPFPIEVPERLPEFWPRHLACYTTVVAEWNRRKIELLQDAGYQVITLELILDGMTIANGTRIRQLFRAGDVSWQDYVPAGTRRCLTENGWSL